MRAYAQNTCDAECRSFVCLTMRCFEVMENSELTVIETQYFQYDQTSTISDNKKYAPSFLHENFGKAQPAEQAAGQNAKRDTRVFRARPLPSAGQGKHVLRISNFILKSSYSLNKFFLKYDKELQVLLSTRHFALPSQTKDLLAVKQT